MELYIYIYMKFPLTALLHEVPCLCTDQQGFLCPDVLKQINLTEHINDF